MRAQRNFIHRFYAVYTGGVFFGTAEADERRCRCVKIRLQADAFKSDNLFVCESLQTVLFRSFECVFVKECRQNCIP